MAHLSLTILAASLLCLCGTFASPCDPNNKQLYLSVVTEDYVSASYVDQSGSGIQLVVKPSGFSVTDMEGSSILKMEDQFYEMNAITYRLIEINGESFLHEVGVKGKSEIYLSPKDAKLFKAAFYSSNAAQCGQDSHQDKYKYPNSVNAEKHRQLVKAFLEDSRIQLLVDIAVELGKDGITGYGYPIMLQFYTTALRIRALRDNPTVQPSGVAERNQVKKSCLDQCPPCKDSGCHGMCGDGCECWSWVCGDCCFHQGCYDHGHCCQEDPYSFSCLFPWNFSCDSYEC